MNNQNEKNTDTPTEQESVSQYDSDVKKELVREFNMLSALHMAEPTRWFFLIHKIEDAVEKGKCPKELLADAKEFVAKYNILQPGLGNAFMQKKETSK